MTAIREQIFAEVDARLAAIAGVEEYQRMPSGDPSRFSALHTFDGGDVPAEEEEETDAMAFVMSLAVEGYVAGDAPHTAANALYTAVIETLFPQPVLGGLATEIRIAGLNMAVAERASKHKVAFALELSIHYHTRFGEPQQPA